MGNKQLQQMISRSRAYQTIKFGLLIDYNTRNIFLEKSYKKYGQENIPRHFCIKSKLSISQDQ